MSVCPVPTAISNGYYVGAKVSYAAGDVIQYVCNTDYVMSGSPVATCSATGVWLPDSGSLPECSTSYFNNIWVLLVLSLIGFIVIVIILLLIALCIRFCCKRRVYDEESETEGHGCCRRFCSCCTCCSADDDDGEKKPKRPAKKPLRKKAPAKKTPAKKAPIKKTPTQKTNKVGLKAGKSTRKKVVSKKGKISRLRKGGKPLKKEKGAPTENDRPSNSRDAKTVMAWKPFANPVRNINTSTK